MRARFIGRLVVVGILIGGLGVAGCGTETERASSTASGSSDSSDSDADTGADGLDVVDDTEGDDATMDDGGAGVDTGGADDADQPDVIEDVGTTTGTTTGAPDPGPDPADDGPPPTSACDNDADMTALGKADVTAVALGCAGGCLGQGPECAATCAQNELGVSPGCGVCVGAVTDCAVNTCGGTCLGGATPECLSCVKNSCAGPFQSCAGVPLPEPPPCTPECTDKACGADGCGGACGQCPGGYCDSGACEVVVDGCDSDDDAAAIAASDPQTEASGCGLQCLTDPDITGCAIACITAATGISGGCAFCFGEQVGCSAQNCLVDCFDPTTPACKACQAASCNPGFEECAGILFPNGLQPGECESGADSGAIAGADIKATVSDCLLNCDGAPDASTCGTECFQGVVAVSPPCAGCFGEVTDCILSGCPTCAEDPSTPACSSCADSSCGGPFLECTGSTLASLFPCEPVCAEDSCGSDSCGASCGACEASQLCVESVCEPLDNAWCGNAQDETALSSTNLTTVMQSCGQGCLGAALLAQCVGECVAAELGLTAACGQCMGTQGECAAANCVADCLADPKSQACIECQEAGCGAAFEACTGLVFGDFFSF